MLTFSGFLPAEARPTEPVVLTLRITLSYLIDPRLAMPQGANGHRSFENRQTSANSPPTNPNYSIEHCSTPVQSVENLSRFLEAREPHPSSVVDTPEFFRLTDQNILFYI